MTRKQMETIKQWFAFRVRQIEEWGSKDKGQEISKTIHIVDDFLKAGYEMRLYDYKKYQKYLKEVMKAGMDELDKINKEREEMSA